MTQKQLQENLYKDLERIGLPTDFRLELRGYSKTYNGRYYPYDSRLIVYATKSNGDLLPYSKIMDTLIHEAIHHYQWKHDKTFVRYKGISHNSDFWDLYNKYVKKAKLMGIIRIKILKRGVVNC